MKKKRQTEGGHKHIRKMRKQKRYRFIERKTKKNPLLPHTHRKREGRATVMVASTAAVLPVPHGSTLRHIRC
jgi:hypothetical protein